MTQIFIKKIKSNKHKISFNGNFSKNIKKDNTVNKLFEILEEKKILNNKKFQIKIKKNIPQEAGLGGGIYERCYNFKFFNSKKIY